MDTNLLKCSRCGEYKPQDAFHKRKDTPDRGFRAFICRECTKLYDKKYYNDNKDKRKEQMATYVINNKDAIKSANKSYYEANKDSIREKTHQYYILNKSKILKRNSIYFCKRIITDAEFAIVRKRRKALCDLVSKRNYTNFLVPLIGVDREGLLSYIESLFAPGMSWDNRGVWEVDHIIPVSYFNNLDENDAKVCWYYKNLRPLWKKDNEQKNTSLPEGWEVLVENIKMEIGLK